jgi:outer membrane lipoprotein
MKTIVPVLLALSLAACASDVPRMIRKAPAETVLPSEVLEAPDAWRGRTVRWGGEIVGVENRRDETWIEIVEKPLYRDGQPRRTDASHGRILGVVPGFLDPAVYARTRSITIAGVLDTPVTRTIGEYSYRYAVVRVASYYLWPIEWGNEWPVGPRFWGYPYPYYFNPWNPWETWFYHHRVPPP